MTELRRGPRVLDRVEERVGKIHRLAIAVDLAILAPHAVGQTRIPNRVLGVGTSDEDVVARAERRQVDLHAGVDAPARLGFFRVTNIKEGRAAHGSAALQQRTVDHVDVVQHARHLGLAPALLHMQGADDVRPALAAEDDVAGIEAARVAAARASHLSAAARAAIRARALGGDRRREAAAERGGVGDQVRLVEALLIGGEEVRPVVAAAGERVERLRLTGGDAGPGQVAGVEVSQVTGVVESVAVFRVDVEMPDQGTPGGVGGEVEPEVGACRPAGRMTVEGRISLSVAGSNEKGRPRVPGERQRERNTGSRRDNVRRRPVELIVEVAARELGGDVAAELHAGVGAGQDPAGYAADVADPNIFHRRRLPGRKIGRLRAGDGDDAGR